MNVNKWNTDVYKEKMTESWKIQVWLLQSIRECIPWIFSHPVVKISDSGIMEAKTWGSYLETRCV